MEELEDSTLDLIYRRRVRTHVPAYVLLGLILLVLISLPLVKVDVTTNVRGMVRPLRDVSELFSSLGGIVDSSLLMDNRAVDAGDTLVWLRRDIPELKMAAAQARLDMLQASAEDIRLILQGDPPQHTAQYRQSYRNFLVARSRLEIRKGFLGGEFSTAENLFSEEVISRHEYNKAQASYLDICARESDHLEGYKSSLENELYRICAEMKMVRDEIRLIQSTLDPYYIQAPVAGVVYDSRSLSSGSVLHAGMSLGKISPSGLLAAECYIHPGQIASVKIGSRVKLRFDDWGFRKHKPLEVVVDFMDEEVGIHRGKTSYRIRCTLHDAELHYVGGSPEDIKNGMTFTASFILFRHSLASLILEKVNLWANPSLTASEDEKES
jgi:HlyD family secretion protein